jgi:excisionase family DNA binding protein
MLKIVKVREVADYLQVHHTTIYRLLKRGEIPAFKIGADWRFNLDEIDAWVANRTAQAQARSASQSRE